MKKILLLIICLIMLNSIPSMAASTNIDKYTNTVELISIDTMYRNIKPSNKDKYFKLLAKKFKKQWKKNKQLFKDKLYETSYVRVQFVVNKNGEILAYKIKSSCVPTGDKEYINYVEQTIANIKNLVSLPDDFNYDYIIFTVKFHTKIPENINKNNISWDKYGIADIEISKNKTKIILK